MTHMLALALVHKLPCFAKKHSSITCMQAHAPCSFSYFYRYSYAPHYGTHVEETDCPPGTSWSQVRQVHKVGQNAPGFGRHINGLFKQALTAGKRVRSETSISTGSVSVSSAAAELAQLKLPTRKFDDAK